MYLPIETPTGDYYGGTRPATISLPKVGVLDARTGKRIWHFQAVHHALGITTFRRRPCLRTSRSMADASR
jgi:quinoprotein glucose dehydrogenase